jgi:hypothetical protein
MALITVSDRYRVDTTIHSPRLNRSLTEPPVAHSATDQVTVTISVDDCGTAEKQIFTLHQGLLCSHSPYFHNAFKGGFRESDEKAIHLPDVTASTLRIFQAWLYGQVSRPEPERSSKRDRHNQEASNNRPGEDMVSTQAVEDKIRLRTPTLHAAWVNTEGII